jgi:serine protease Do
MYHKFVFSVLIGAASIVSLSAQTPDPKAEKGSPLNQSFAFSFDGGSYLGVQTREVTRENFAKLGLREVRGVAVDKVVEGSPAASAGLKDGDVIVRFNGDEVTSTRKLSRLVSEVSPDHQVKLVVLRAGREQEIIATVGKSPGPSFENGNFKFSFPEGAEKWDPGKLKDLKEFRELVPMENFRMEELPRMFDLPEGAFSWTAGNGRQIGVSVYPVTKQLGDRYGVQSGLMINTVRENSAAAKAGLRAGDIIVDVDGKTVSNELELIRSINERKEGSITVNLMRDGSRQTVTVTPEVSKDGGFFYQMDDDDSPKPRGDKDDSPKPRVDKLRLTLPKTRETQLPIHSLFPARVI